MKTLTTLKISFLNLRTAVLLSPLAFLFATFGEGLQHVVEWQLGMFKSLDMFKAHQDDTIRLGFGIFKGLSLFVGCYFIAKKLFEKFGPPPRFGSFKRDFIRKSWDPSFGLHGLIAFAVCAIPLIIAHYKISYFAMGHDWAPALLIVDSFIVGSIALVLGTTIWAGDVVTAEND